MVERCVVAELLLKGPEITRLFGLIGTTVYGHNDRHFGKDFAKVPVERLELVFVALNVGRDAKAELTGQLLVMGDKGYRHKSP
jgi:hypothetical protein